MDLPSDMVSEGQDTLVKKPKTITGVAILMCVLGALFYYYEYYLRVAPSVMGAELKQTFFLGEAAFGHLAACYYYAYTPLQIPAGVMMDRFGPRRVLTLACFLCAFGTYLFAATTHITIAQIGRFLVGFGSAFAYVGVLKISNYWLPSRYFALMAGLCTALGMLGGISGAVLMSDLVTRLGWQSTLYYSALPGIVLTFILWFILRDEKDTETEIVKSVKTTSPQFEGLKEMLLSPQMWICGMIGCLTFLPISGFAEVWAVSFLQTVGMTKADAAFGSSMIFLGFAIGGPLWGILSDRIQSRRIPLILGSFISAGLMALAIFMPSTSLLWMYSLLFFSAFFASVEILIFAVSNDLSRSSVSATAISFTNMLVMIGGALLPPLIGKLLDNVLHLSQESMPVITINDFSMALAVLPLALIVSGVLSYLLKESYHRHGNS